MAAYYTIFSVVDGGWPKNCHINTPLQPMWAFLHKLSMVVVKISLCWPFNNTAMVYDLSIWIGLYLFNTKMVFGLTQNFITCD
jgi:hypothetical protein